MIVGHLPFGDDGDDTYTIAQNICTEKHVFPKELRDNPEYYEVIHFIDKLLIKEARKRFNGNYAIFKNHSFLEGFDFVFST